MDIALPRLDGDRQKRYSLSLQCLTFPFKERVVVRGGQAGPHARKTTLNFGQFLLPVGQRIPLAVVCVAIAIVIEIEVGACDSMLVAAYPVDAPHEHESHAP